MWIMVDIESDGPAPGLYSMISFGAVVVEPDLDETFYVTLAPISSEYIPEALEVSGFSREETLTFPKPEKSINQFNTWLQELGERPYFVSDNNGFDWQFINYYFWRFLGKNPFGHSSTNLGSLYKGLVGDTFKNFKHLRKTKHSHNPVDDAMGNAEALITMKRNIGLKIKL